MIILAIDPGNLESAYCLMDENYKPLEHAKVFNETLINRISHMDGEGARMPEVMAIEMVASYGMPVGKEVFETCVWIGRFWEKYHDTVFGRVETVYRMEEKMALCHDSKARDSNIRRALIDRFARFDKDTGKGTKKYPDFFYGFKKDEWSAFAVGCTFLDKTKGAAK